MARDTFHVRPGDVGWQCARGDGHVVGTFATFDDALRVAQSLAATRADGDVLVHLPQGTELDDVLFR